MEKLAKEIIGEMKCLRSGACCISFEVHGVPGYKDGIKPENQACLHLKPAFQDINGIWHRAKCMIHGGSEYPEECRKFNFPGPNDTCGLGQAIWKNRGIDHPDTNVID